MTRVTIDHGMDLGTTTCSIATMRGTEPYVIPNREGALFTPSAIWVDKRSTVRVGREAKERYINQGDYDNVGLEFKLRMRPELVSSPTKFVQAGRSMTAAELSAEMIKALKADVHMHTGEELRSLVITVPADFEAPQNIQTEEAARLAGIEFSPLLQEPVAAALAYGFQAKASGAFWLVYDFGGGTFDAAIVKVEDDFIDVVEHAGDNHLGGKLVDWDIVEKLLVPEVRKLTRLDAFQRQDARWRVQFARLKGAAEQAKVEVSRLQRAFTIRLDEFVKDAGGGLLDFEFELQPAQLRDLYAPYIERSLNLCRNALQRKGLSSQALEKVILVGGATQYPGLRDAVRSELGVPLDFTIDPVTVVARGAAVFAATQRVPAKLLLDAKSAATRAINRLQLEYDPIGTTDAPEVVGKIVPPGDQTLDSGFTVRISEQQSHWQSGKVPVAPNGAFIVELHAEPGRRNTYTVELFDKAGGVCPVEPSEFPYTMGRPPTAAQTARNLGIACADNTVDILFPKGTTVPARATTTHQAVKPLTAGSDDCLRILFVGGVHERADRNPWVGWATIRGNQVQRSIPLGAEIQITVKVTESLTLEMAAYVPAIDQDFEAVLEQRSTMCTLAELEQRLETCRQRHGEYQRRAERSEDAQALQMLGRIRGENLLEQAVGHVATARGCPDHVPEAEIRLLELMAALDRVEDALAFPDLVATAEAEIEDAERILGKYAKDSQKGEWRRCEAAIASARKARDPVALRQSTRELAGLTWDVLLEQPGWWLGQLEKAEADIEKCKDPAAARRCIAQGRRAVDSDDFESLKAAVRQLWKMMASEGTSAATGVGTSMRGDTRRKDG